MLDCPNCGKLNKDEIHIYNESLRKQNFSLSPILPVCKHCGAKIKFTHKCNGGIIIVINGTCGSGKSTIAEILVGKGFLAIDGDCVIQTVRHKTGKKQYEWKELIDEITCEIDVLSMYGENIVLSHVIMPDDLEEYIGIFKARNLKYRFILLKPEYSSAVERCNIRACHTSVTPEYWIKHFYDLLVFDNQVTVVNNTDMTPVETAEYILEMIEMKQCVDPFWSALDKLASESKIVIDRPKGSHHPKYPTSVYPVDYGYLENTSSMDGGGIDVWKGADGENIDAIICTVDLIKKDSEIKILIGCSEVEKQLVLGTYSEYMKGILIRRDS